MRVLLKLRANKSHSYENDYHYHLQSAVYSLIREGGLPDVHEKRGYKFFCFSNIFPFGDFKQGEERSLLVSSPDPDIIHSIESSSFSRVDSRKEFFVGELQFEISSVSKPFRINMEGPEVIVRSATPIVMRIPKARYEEYGIKPKVDYGYVFWRETIPLEAFIKQLQDNIAKKWKEYFSVDTLPTAPRYEKEDESVPEITYYKFNKTVSKPITLRQEKQMVIGSLWEMGFAINNSQERQVLDFAMECGFGERNSLGFGFVNPST